MNYGTELLVKILFDILQIKPDARFIYYLADMVCMYLIEFTLL